MQIEALHDKKNLIDIITYGIEANMKTIRS